MAMTYKGLKFQAEILERRGDYKGAKKVRIEHLAGALGRCFEKGDLENYHRTLEVLRMLVEQ